MREFVNFSFYYMTEDLINLMLFVNDYINSGLTVVNRKKRYRLVKLPQYLILHLKRFTKNNFFVEKNRTIVNFPVRNLELREYMKRAFPTTEELMAL